MRVGHLNVTRPDWYDRQPVTKTSGYGANNEAPGGAVIKWAYTVPSTKNVWLDTCRGSISRQTAAAVLGRTLMEIQIADPTLTYIHGIIQVELQNNTVGVRDSSVVPYCAMLPNGWTLSAVYQDLSTGGGINISVGAMYTEFTPL